jgi:UDP-N-acetylmuramoyl-L-alanyl-D-glutamate--2,6-diaminopimelate ligase
VITLFGCGGERDRGKRPIMGEIATRLSDYAIITSDNPRSEDPIEIIQQIVSGVSGDGYRVVPDRREAIALGVEMAGAGDIVLIAGKGHEEYQEIKGVRHPFSDRETAEHAIKNKMRGYRIP